MFCNFLAGLFPLRLPLSRSNSTTRLLGDHILEVVLLVGDAVALLQVVRDIITVQEHGLLAQPAPGTKFRKIVNEMLNVFPLRCYL